MKKILFAIALAVVATACHTDNDGGNTVQMGKIAIEATTRGEVNNSDLDSSDKFILESVPAENELRVEIVGNGQTFTWNTLAEFNIAADEGLAFAVAPYTITLSHGEKGAEGWSKPHFEGSTSVEVPGYGLTAEASVEVALTNSIIAIDTTDNFDGYFPQSTFKVKEIAWETAKKELLFMNPGEVKIVCEATRQSGAVVTLETTVTLKASTRHTVLFDLSTAGNATLTISFDNEIVATEEFEFELNENA